MKPKKIAKILIVDDIEDNIKLISIILKSEMYDVYEALSGEEAIKKAKETKPDLILLDVMMPGMDGYTVCEKLKEDPDTENIPIIFITAKAEMKDIVKGFKIGAVDYIKKPFRAEEIRVRVNIHIELKKTKDILEKKFDKERKLTKELQEALSKVKTLSGLLPICCYCHKIKDDKGYWQRVDEYIRRHSDADFTHGICGDCREKVMKDLEEKDKKNKKDKKD